MASIHYTILFKLHLEMNCCIFKYVTSWPHWSRCCGVIDTIILFINFLYTHWTSTDMPPCLFLLHYYQIAKIISWFKCFPEPACLLTSQNYPRYTNGKMCQLECLQTKAATQTYTVSTLWFTYRRQTVIQNLCLYN
jgi:hypothetical protein